MCRVVMGHWAEGRMTCGACVGRRGRRGAVGLRGGEGAATAAGAGVVVGGGGGWDGGDGAYSEWLAAARERLALEPLVLVVLQRAVVGHRRRCARLRRRRRPLPLSSSVAAVEQWRPRS